MPAELKPEHKITNDDILLPKYAADVAVSCNMKTESATDKY